MLSELLPIWTQASSNKALPSSRSPFLQILWPRFRIGSRTLFTAPACTNKQPETIDHNDTIKWRWQIDGKLAEESFDSTIEQFIQTVYRDEFDLLPINAITSKSIADQYANQGEIPDDVVELLYETRDRELKNLRAKVEIAVDDIATLDRGARCLVVNDLWSRCAASTKESLLNDVNHLVRSCAQVASADEPIYLYELFLEGYDPVDEATYDRIKFVESRMSEEALQQWLLHNGLLGEAKGVLSVNCVDVRNGVDLCLPNDLVALREIVRLS